MTQRTHQMNFSGNRYEQEDVARIAADPDLDAWMLRCHDKFGEYGIIGFGIVRKSDNRLIDLMFSCRIQSKRVEHAFMTFCLEHYLPHNDFWVTYRHTERNRFSAQVFYDFGFEQLEIDTALRELRFSRGREIPDDQIVTISK